MMHQNRNSVPSSYMTQLEKDRRIFTFLEEIRGQVRQNSLMIQALLQRQPQLNQDGASLCLDLFQFPLSTKEDIGQVERMLMEQATEKALVCDSCTVVWRSVPPL
ncbi:UNVERIFIED_CONTAM: hypothetical protein FKN15_051206 [Acipenser sinensis]